MKRKSLPIWLRRLDLVKADLKGWRFPRNAEEGLLLCAALSAANLKIFYATAGKHPDRLLEKLRQFQAARIPIWKKHRARSFGG